MSDEREYRIEKLEALRAEGVEPYPTTVTRTMTIGEAREGFEELQSQGQEITLAGRLMGFREHGKSAFANIEDQTGSIQIYFKKDLVGEEAFTRLRQLDLSDFVEASGTLFTTRSGEKTLQVQRYRVLSKALRPLPAKGAGGALKLFDEEVRYRKRYLDLLANRETEVPIFLARARILSAMREFLNAQGFVEVETPILQPLYGGATARPFTTFHNAAERELFLRIAPELYLKRLIVGGIERVYEIARNFRNEGVDHSHNPEFTMMECYMAYADYRDMMNLVEQMTVAITQAVLGRLTFEYQGTPIDVSPPFKRMTLREAIAEHTGIDYDEYPTRESLAAVMRERGYEVNPVYARGRLIDELKDAVVKGKNAAIKQPTFLYDYPVDLSPLAKRKPGTTDIAERFQLFIGGLELGNAFTELNDPLDQRARFEDQMRQRAGGDVEAQMLDEDYLEALEVGMPPTAGYGGGIDRLAMLLTDQDSIREVILFPTLREQRQDQPRERPHEQTQG